MAATMEAKDVALSLNLLLMVILAILVLYLMDILGPRKFHGLPSASVLAESLLREGQLANCAVSSGKAFLLASMVVNCALCKVGQTNVRGTTDFIVRSTELHSSIVPATQQTVTQQTTIDFLVNGVDQKALGQHLALWAKRNGYDVELTFGKPYQFSFSATFVVRKFMIQFW